jgi:hypothetical protein
VYLTDITNVKISNLLLYILNGKSLFFAITVLYLSFRKKPQSTFVISQEDAIAFCHSARSCNPLLSLGKKTQTTFVISQEDAVEIEISCTAGRSRSVQLVVAVFSRSRSLLFRKKTQSTFVISQEDAVEIEISCTAGRSRSVQSQSFLVNSQEAAIHFCHFARSRSRNRNLLQRRQKQKCSVGSRSIQSQSTFVISQEDAVEIEISCNAGCQFAVNFLFY